ncbi:hypothetical protein JW905_13660 [bacterium]|nr:hypothetical protein [candidate division CSSED10-310 bacterium]
MEEGHAHRLDDGREDALSTLMVATIVPPSDDGSLLRIVQDSLPESCNEERCHRLEVPVTVMQPVRVWMETRHDQDIGPR